MAESTGELFMFTYETADQKEVRRFRIAQFNGRAATVRDGEATITGHVRSVLEKAASVPLLDHHHRSSRAAAGEDRPALHAAFCVLRERGLLLIA
jgi:hypothetical protein